MNQTTKQYFASLNTTNGFKSYFDKVFNPEKLEKIYILKGGPGTGKSGLMKYISEEAKKLKLDVEEFLCSSDPNSLDGILIPEMALAIFDGTSPHMKDPVFPGVVEHVINTGSFWNTVHLLEHKKAIISLMQEKKRLYLQAYRFLKAYGEIEEELLHLSKEFLLEEKMAKTVQRLSDLFFRKQGVFSQQIRNTVTVCGKGIVSLNTFESLSEKIYYIRDEVFSAYHFLDALYEEGKKKGQAVTVSHSFRFPDRLNGLYFPTQRLCFVIADPLQEEQEAKECHIINMKRLLDGNRLKNHKEKIKFGKKCSQMLLEGTTQAFGEAAKIHCNLEHYYLTAMNFDRLQSEIQVLREEIFR